VRRDKGPVRVRETPQTYREIDSDMGERNTKAKTQKSLSL